MNYNTHQFKTNKFSKKKKERVHYIFVVCTTSWREINNGRACFAFAGESYSSFSHSDQYWVGKHRQIPTCFLSKNSYAEVLCYKSQILHLKYSKDKQVGLQ